MHYFADDPLEKSSDDVLGLLGIDVDIGRVGRFGFGPGLLVGIEDVVGIGASELGALVGAGVGFSASVASLRAAIARGLVSPIGSKSLARFRPSRQS